MSLLDTQRQLAKPIYEAAKALHEHYRFVEPFDTCSARYQQGRKDDAAAIIIRLRELGFITPDGLDAIRAEEAGETNGR